MTLSTVQSAVLFGAEARPVTVECHAGQGLPSFTVIGMPDTYCREVRDRVRAAMASAGFEWLPRRYTVSLSPHELPKSGAHTDLAIALALLTSNGQLPKHMADGYRFIGELGLDGSVRPVRGELACCSLPGAVAVTHRRVSHLSELREGYIPIVDEETEVRSWTDHTSTNAAGYVAGLAGVGLRYLDSQDAKSAATEMAQFMWDSSNADEMRQAFLAHDIVGSNLTSAPMRAPHYTTSMVALVGGGTAAMRPGEYALAHCGTLLLEEVHEFTAQALDSLRSPLREHRTTVSRAASTVTYPSRFGLVVTLPDCPCQSQTYCRCSEVGKARHSRRTHGLPLIDGKLAETLVIKEGMNPHRARAEYDERLPMGNLPLVTQAVKDGRLSARGVLMTHRVLAAMHAVCGVHDEELGIDLVAGPRD